MTRFSATEPAARRDLFAEGIRAHASRGSGFVTFEAEGADESPIAPWVQFAAADGLLNLDCTEAELAAIESVVDGFGGARITDRTSPDDVDGVNCKITVSGDPERVAMLLESLFHDGFDLPETYRVWVVEL